MLAHSRSLLLERNSRMRVRGCRGRYAETLREQMHLPRGGMFAMRGSRLSQGIGDALHGWMPFSRVSSARIENSSSKSRALTLQDVKDAPEEVKTLSRKPNQDQAMPVIQSQTNELTELLSSQESRLSDITSEAGATENAETVQRTAASSSTVSQEPTTRRNPEVKQACCWLPSRRK
ncbi:hypothetical protein HPB51_028225 [Rhipicephalus microplus]|uniref:Uncharacterized protein n=1 Tax=Rhipicephalus microplus TaxID=6941 RepID=A0A9J6CY76_RHIMP|nr:hypothetical protein HPB51_028225 [Rhipicephalus microplus]